MLITKHRKEHFGFELYDEIWNYDFDSIKEKNQDGWKFVNGIHLLRKKRE